MSTRSVIGVTRPPFLILAPVCVSVGIAAAVASGLAVDWAAAAVALAGALAAHVSVNALNEYGDFRSGLDFRTKRTAFSGGSGTLVTHPQLAPQARLIGLLALAVAVAAGILLVWRSGWGLLPLGLLGLGLIYFYTDAIYRNRYLCLIAPGLGFGPLMVLGTHYAVTGGLSPAALAASLVPFFLVSNLLLLNQFPDVDADRSVGRDSFPVARGWGFSLGIYGLFAALAYLSILAGMASGLLPLATGVAVFPAAAALHVYRGVRGLVAGGAAVAVELTPFLALNVAVTLVTPALVALGLAMAP